ncbi:hypothetical protein [Niabella beijingensis]|uniref:hypothetical protein n=1 Tax=Niabella beijingensis TaxID=2872700 RepID=UPI001CBD96D6|nr:hypothetical protein [Niabella beijingensis]MBZ4188288.1 hypothetical protein [Niabella beijingensis]
MKPSFYFSLLAGAATGLTFLSCQQLSKSFEETRNPKPQKEAVQETGSSTTSTSTVIIRDHAEGQTAGPGIFEDAEALDRIQQELENLPQFRGKKLMLYQSLHFYDFQGGRISINIQNPDTTENVDTYVYFNGKWQEPAPVKIIGQLQTEVDFFMPLDRIRFATAKKINDITREKLKGIPGGHTNGFIYFNCMRIKRLNREEAGWYVQIQGSRSDTKLDFDVEGNLKKEMKL